MTDKRTLKIKVSDKISVTSKVFIKGGEIQNVPTSGTTTMTQEMAEALDQSVSPSPSTSPSPSASPSPSPPEKTTK